MADGQIWVLVSMIVGAGISMVSHWFHVRHQEKLRKEARWESYSEQRWHKLSDHLCDLVDSALSTCQLAFAIANEGPPFDKKLRGEFVCRAKQLERLQGRCLVLASASTNKILFGVLMELRLVALYLGEENREAAHHAVAASAKCLDLAEAVRVELGVAALDQAFRKTLVQHLEGGDKLTRLWL